jgi:hypothetical protein
MRYERGACKAGPVTHSLPGSDGTIADTLIKRILSGSGEGIFAKTDETHQIKYSGHAYQRIGQSG